MAITKAWRVYGANGHRQRESFNKSERYNWSSGAGKGFTRIIEVENSDKTGTNDYSIIRITRDTAEECEKEFIGQLSDGVFENSKVGRWEEIEHYYWLDTNYYTGNGDWALIRGEIDEDGEKARWTEEAVVTGNFSDTAEELGTEDNDLIWAETNRIIEQELGFLPDYEIN